VDDARLLELYHQGWIPGPHESEDEFYARINYRDQVVRLLGEDFTPSQDSVKLLKEAGAITYPLFQFSLEGVALVFANQGLSLWEGGVAWIFQLQENSPQAAFIQLRSCFEKSKRWLFYDRSELIAHEACHVARMAYQEPYFEEMLAYQTSKSWLRRLLGSLFLKSWETSTFLLLFCLAWGMTLFLSMSVAWIGWLLLKLFSIFLFGRLTALHILYWRAKNKLSKAFNSQQTAQSLLFLATDAEIYRWGKMNEEELKASFKTDIQSLRRRLMNIVSSA
jgi:hypothetical protein